MADNNFAKSAYQQRIERDYQHAFLLVCIGVFGLFAFAALGLYSYKLLNEVEQLESLIKRLEAHQSEDSLSNKDEFAVPLDREKRKSHDLHMNREHHGITPHNTALIFGDPALIRDSEQDFVNKTPYSDCDGTYFERKRDSQRWCRRIRTGSLDKYQTGSSNRFPYFSMASWMSIGHPTDNFNVTRTGEIVVQSSGLYIIQASVHFVTGRHASDSVYRVLLKRNTEENYRIVSKCFASIERKAENLIYPCQTQQLYNLQYGDSVWLSIHGYRWFVVEKETLHLALIKLN